MTRTLRVRSFSFPDYSGFQLLQEKCWWGWRTIDREDIPQHVRISMGAFGDAGGWVSKFVHYGKWGRDGIIH